MTQKTLIRFKPYDIRGEINVNIDETVSYRIGRADAHHFNLVDRLCDGNHLDGMILKDWLNKEFDG